MATRRERSIRSVLLVAVLTTVATSAPQASLLDDIESRMIAPLDILRVHAVFSADASEQAKTMTVRFRWTGSGSVMLVPDDPLLPPIQLVAEHEIDALEACSVAGTCDLGFTLDTGDAASGMLEVSATAGRGGEASCFADNADFSDDATVDVVFE